MDSINQNQPEENRRDLNGPAALAQIREIVDDAGSCFFCTFRPDGQLEGARPMAVQEVDDAGNLWFLSASDSYKNAELARDAEVELFFQASAHAGFLRLHGLARASRDRQRIRELWKPVMKTWFTEGEDDARITVLQVRPTGGYYWDNKHGNLVAGVKMLIGAMTGKTLDDSIEGKLRV